MSQTSRYGSLHESAALDQFKAYFANQGTLQESGLLIHPEEHWLAASPDAIFVSSEDGQRCLVEVKCPFSVRDCTIDEAIASKPTFCLKKTDEGRRILKKTHAYYYQMQIGMLVSGGIDGILVVYTQKEMCILMVKYDNTLVSSILPKLKTFYFKHFLPALYASCISK